MEPIVCDTSQQIESVAFCPQVYEGEAPLIIVSSSSLEGSLWGGALVLIDGQTGESLCSTTFDCGISASTWCGNGFDMIACGGDDGLVRLTRTSMDVDFAFKNEEPKDHTRGHDDIVSCIATNSLKPNQILSGSLDFSVKLWDIAAMDSNTQTFQGHVAAVWNVAWSRVSADSFASVSQDSFIQIWDARAEIPVVPIQTDHAACSIDWHPKKENVISVGLEDGEVVTYDIRSPSLPLHVMTDHTGCVYNVKYSTTHEDMLASASDDTTVRLLQNASSGTAEIVFVYEGHHDYVRGLDWSYDGTSMLATGSWDKSLHIWTSA